MLAVVGLAMLAFVGSCAVVGVRLLRLGQRGGGRVASLCGNGFCLIAVLGFPLGVVSGNGAGPVGEVHLSLAAISLVANALGIGCFLGFTVTVFRPGALWAHTLAGAACAALACSAVGVFASVAVAQSDASSFEVAFGWAATFHWVCVLCFGWMGIEGFLEWSRSKRRLALGLSDPVVCNRLLMFGLFGLSTTLLVLVLAAVHHSGQSTATSVVAQVAQAAFGAGSSVAILLAFMPPARYRRWLLGGSPSEGALAAD